MTCSPAPFAGFHPAAPFTSALREAITRATRRPEPQAVAEVLDAARLDEATAAAVQRLGRRIAEGVRRRQREAGSGALVQGLLQEYALSSQEGVALMCLAEALLRIPDAATRDALIRDKLAQGDWGRHLGRSPSLFVNAATWGLLVTGRLTATHSESGLGAALGKLLARGGEPLIRKGVDLAMRLMGEQFVTGETIEEALRRAAPREAEGFRYSFDMLGEAALTEADAQRYLLAYEHAIHAIGRAARGRGVLDGPGISIKLSALHPRYSRAQQARVMGELYPRLLGLCRLARGYDIGLNIDAEEAERLSLSLDLLERLCQEPDLAGWTGLGFVVQAYQKRCPAVIDWLVDLARRSGRRLMVRLVKGAYWDAEIKRAQLDGLDDYPVYTRKVHTDAAYLACARQLLAAPDAVFPQFATHNAHTLAAVYELAGPARYEPGQYEFQCLHGMGEPLYEQVVGRQAQGGLGRACRIYAPVGTHETLLAYLVRRLLENGANSSFVHRIADPALSLDELLREPAAQIDESAAREGAPGLPHPAIPLPRALFGPTRLNSRGLDLADEHTLDRLQACFQGTVAQGWSAPPLLAADTRPATDAVRNPAAHADVVGHTREADDDEVERALAEADRAAPSWSAVPASERASLLERAADRLEDDMPRLMALLVREAGKTAANAVAEVREAVDFLRYYAGQARDHLGEGEVRPLGAVVCISPWNFPLAIFCGQVAAALAAGNTVLAKPAEQTPLIAAEAVRALWDAGVPRAAVQLLPGRGETVGARLVGDARVQGVLFTGSTEVARLLQRQLAGRLGPQGRPVPLVAETGGQNAMIVDSSALPEQVVADVIGSAFDSAGQRCSALRVLCVQRELAPRVRDMLLGAMAELQLGRTDRLAVDVGPVIDEDARRGIEAHLARMRAQGRAVHQVARAGQDAAGGSFVTPALVELDRLDTLDREVFGPVLHLLSFERERLGELLAQIERTGYALTLGLHTRIDETVAQVLAAARAGNVYVNRNMVGAVVGVQPFGGEGLSGTGPKAGGPLYLYRLLAQAPRDVLGRALAQPGVRTAAVPSPARPALASLTAWAAGHPRLEAACRRFAQAAVADGGIVLPGPTGERNAYRIAPRDAVLCLAEDDADRLVQLAAVLAVGSRAVWPGSSHALASRFPAAVRACIDLVEDWAAPDAPFDAVLFHGDAPGVQAVQQVLADRPGPIVNVERLAPGEDEVRLERLVVERSTSINTAAAGGNATLMSLET
ncbi:trifunctional transcriptional regulator/proline dehydrogenase/L-glutamate gamma-semialdehyde dehydrogenase [Ramlibacter rhizophilus]|uniref:Bifunctional protein PutA n=1 Tax=Ramlibacter rhizophilus TaxID=1781167 RepID=A0A4Z0C4J3_9BURK|nr:trifunctional transcriptional regulator/proline dehydrogenase/L-glutamate gamma-semialdehyde dehydrogenase [Ramlibacter rhizophilus]TFZ05085.1 trifunctional transcriptional regulator/proline dehydrogenase/L-glutamate gamma-semialdehyde dehydrogenase [Ramlibacter rhizophilus]